MNTPLTWIATALVLHTVSSLAFHVWLVKARQQMMLLIQYTDPGTQERKDYHAEIKGCDWLIAVNALQTVLVVVGLFVTLVITLATK